MPISPELLQQISEAVTEAKRHMDSAEDVIKDLRASGIDASVQEQALSEAKKSYNQLSMFYSLQKNKV